MDDLKARGARAFVWDLMGKMGRQGTIVIVTIILARLLEPHEFGLIALAIVVIEMAFIFTDMGLGAALIQRTRVLPVHYASAFYFNIGVGALLMFCVWFGAEWISLFYNNPDLIPVLQAVSSLFVINALSSVQVSKLRKELNFSALAKADVGAAVLSGVVGISMALMGAGVWSLVAQAISRGIFYNLIIWSLSKWMPTLLFSMEALRELWAFGFRMFLSRLLELIYTRIDIIIIGKLFSPALLGFYDQAKRLEMLIIQYSSGSLMNVLFPVLSQVQDDLERFQRIVVKMLGIICFIVFFLLGMMYLVSEELIVLLLTEKWLQTVVYFKILLMSGFAYPVSALLVNVLSSRGNSKGYLKLEIYKKLVLSINLSIAFIWGIEGYLYGLIIASTVTVALNILFAQKEIGLSFWIFMRPLVVQALITVLLVVLICMMTQNWSMSLGTSLLVEGALFFLLYFMVNSVVKTESYQSFAEQAYPKIKQLLAPVWRNR